MTVAASCQNGGLSRIRISTTVDEATLTAARALGLGNDAVLINAALAALVAAHRRAEIDRSYEAYDRIPLNTADEWGDLESFLDSLPAAELALRRKAADAAEQG